MADVFISYSRKDRDFVLKLHEALARNNRDAWVDWHDIPLMADFLREIYAGIEGADNFVFVISPESVDSATCQKEIAHAARNKKRLIPIFHRYVPDKDIPKKGTRTVSSTRPSRPTVSASSPLARTIRRGCGTRPTGNRWPSSKTISPRTQGGPGL
jgi:hypothetical protein